MIRSMAGLAWGLAMVLVVFYPGARLAGAQRISDEQQNQAVRLYNQGRAQYQSGNVDQAIALYKAALAIDPSLADALTNLGFALDYQGNCDEAVADYNLSLKLKPNNGVTLSD